MSFAVEEFDTIAVDLTKWSPFSCVCPVIDHEFRHNIVKIAVDPRGDSRVDPQTGYFDNVMTKFIVNDKTDAW